MSTAFFWVIIQRVVTITYRRFGTTYRPCLEESRIKRFLTIEDGTDRLCETSVNNYHNSLQKNHHSAFLNVLFVNTMACTTDGAALGRPLDFCLHRHPVSVNCLYHPRMVLSVGRVLCTKCTLHSNHRLTRVIFQNTKQLLPRSGHFLTAYTRIA